MQVERIEIYVCSFIIDVESNRNIGETQCKFQQGVVLNSFPSTYDLFIFYHLNNTKTILIELHNLLQATKAGMKKCHSKSSISTLVKAIKQRRGKKRKAY